MSRSIRATDKTYNQLNELKANGYESLTNALSVAVDRLYRAEGPKGEVMTIYISQDADYWGANPTGQELSTLVQHVETIGQEWTGRPIEVEIVQNEERNEGVAHAIVEAAWNRMF